MCGDMAEPSGVRHRCARPASDSLPLRWGAHADKWAEELLDAYISIDDADTLYTEFSARGVEFARGVADMPWGLREFVVKDCDGRLLAFGANQKEP